jgi:nucleotide-binding universal stress UspA family protein
MNLKLILARLQNALGQDVQNLILRIPTPASAQNQQKNTSERSLNLVVGYDGSPDSQVALDLALLIAHQTRLATQNRVTIHVVYVLDDVQIELLTKIYSSPKAVRQWQKKSISVATHSGTQALATKSKTVLLAQADQILWQARCLADEAWKGTFVAHLRFGSLAAELEKIVETETADLLLLGCRSQDSLVIRQLSTNLPCVVLGISKPEQVIEKKE